MEYEQQRIRASLKDLITAFRSYATTQELVDMLAKISYQLNDISDLCDDTEHISADFWYAHHRKLAQQAKQAELEKMRSMRQRDHLDWEVRTRRFWKR